MIISIVRYTLALLLVLPVIYSAVCFADEANLNHAIPTEHFASLPAISTPKISPDGTRIAFIINVDDKQILLVQGSTDSNRNEPPGKIGVGDYFIQDYLWANNDRLIVRIRGSVKFQKQMVNVTRLIAVGRDGSNPVYFKITPDKYGYYRQHPQVIHLLPNDNEHVLAVLDNNKDIWAAPEVDKVNVYTGKKRRVVFNHIGVHSWLADANGEVRIGEKIDTGRKTNVTTYYREDSDSSWGKIQKADYFDNERLQPYDFHPDNPGILLVSKKETDAVSRHRVELTDEELFEYHLGSGELLGEYKNERLLQVKKKVEKKFANQKIEYISVDDKKERYIFKTVSAAKPAVYYQIDLAKNAFGKIGSEYPKLDGVNFSDMRSWRYKARDGLNIPSYITLPNTDDRQKPFPLIVFPHGGPWSHDEWGFDSYVQFFANRGYAVFQPQFRGSTGYGVAHLEAGYGQWGAAIQDDITDGVKLLIEQGVVDPDNICIVGASFGGYAAAMGLVKTPELYRCAVSINGVFNLPSMYSDLRYLLFAQIKRKIWNDKKDLEPYSPYHNRYNISAPLLIIASKKDTVVPYKQSKNMYKKMKKLREDVEYIELKEGEHWRTYEPNEIAIFKALDIFLAKHLD